MATLLFLVGVLVVAVGIALSIALHEVGHLVPAKAFGVKVTQYMVGFGPTILSRRKGETEYGLKAVPLGGYIAMIGMYPPAAAVGDTSRRAGWFRTLVQDARDSSAEGIGEGEDSRTFYRLPIPKRLVIMFGGPVMNLIIGTVLIGILLVGIGAPSVVNRVADVSPCLTPTSSGACPAGADASPARAAGFRAGDTIVSVDGARTATWADVSAAFAAAAGRRLTVVVSNDGARRTLTVTPASVKAEVATASGGTRTETVGRVGVTAATDYRPLPVSEVPAAVGAQLGATVGVIVTLPARLADIAGSVFEGRARDPNGPMSIVGAGRVAGDVAASGDLGFTGKVQSLLGILASLNIFLFVLNLVPLPPLDGGHIAAAIWEGIKRGFARLTHRAAPRPADTAKLVPVTFAVVAVLGVMSVFLIIADIVKPVNPFG